MKTIKLIISSFTLSLLMIASINLAADSYIFSFNTLFPGNPTPDGVNPWITAQFTDTSAGHVSLVLATPGLSTSTGHNPSDYVSEWNFNFNPAQYSSLGALVFSRTSAGNPDNPTIPTPAIDAFKADGDGFYDISLIFPTTGNRFIGGLSVTYDITDPGNVNFNAASFNFVSTPGGGAGNFYSAAHIQSIGASGTDSAWVGALDTPALVPEPSTYLLLAAFAMLAIGLKSYRAAKKTA